MILSSLVLQITDTLKPILIKIIPSELLRKAKKRYLQKKIGELGKVALVPFQKEEFPKGINLIGNIKGDSGLGQSCRLLANALEHCNYPVSYMQHSISRNLSSMDTTFDDKLKNTNEYAINIFHINAHEFTTAYLQLGREKWDKHYNIAYWLWELEEFPEEWVNCINLLDEIWTPAEFVSESIRKKTDKPVFTVPYHVIAPTDEHMDRDYFKIPRDRFLFLMMFDCGSMIERKNPKAVIKAFMRAFDKENKAVGLVIKINGGSEKQISEINEIGMEYNNIYLIHETFSKVEVNSLIKCVDVLVSLHRAEGFGLVMAEAMLNGVPCIATNWSANTEFMNHETACMVDYELVELKNDIGPYKKGNRWAEADIGQASEFMIKLFEDKAFYNEKKEKALISIRSCLGMEQVTERINKRIDEILM